MTKVILLFIIGLVCLIKGGDYFVDGATGIAHRFNMPEILIGATVVSIGTTLPEVMVSATAAVSGHSQIAYGNAIGSIICNTSLILAITAAVKPQKVERKGLVTPVIFFFVAAAFYAGVAYISGYFSRLTGILLLTVFVIYMVKLVREAFDNKDGNANDIAELSGTDTVNTETVNTEAVGSDADSTEVTGTETDNAEVNDCDKTEMPAFMNTIYMEILLLVGGAALIAVGADLLVDNGTLLAAAMGVPESVIALTFVALGTSLPELVTAITSLIKGYGALSLGNVIGANLFNLVLVSGMASALCPFKVPAEKYIAGINSSLVVDVPLVFIVMLIATVPTIAKGKIARWQGVLLLCIYAAFITSQFIM